MDVAPTAEQIAEHSAVAALRKAIEDAPHDEKKCRRWVRCEIPVNDDAPEYYSCNCWKSTFPLAPVLSLLSTAESRILAIEGENRGLESVIASQRRALDEAEARERKLSAALLSNRQGYLNILEFRKLDGKIWGERDGYGGRYGALTREEIESVVAAIDAALAPQEPK